LIGDLYRRGGVYEFRSGFNPVAILSLAVGVACALIGLVAPALHWLYDYAWFVGFFISGGLYFLLMKRQFAGGK
jgi:NCS1 family nucleobase:cation symporter-1